MSLYQIVSDKGTTVVAAGAVSINLWLPWLQSVSEIAALFVPIAGFFWLAVQISLKLHAHFGARNDKDKD